jgi:hypothetical protein
MKLGDDILKLLQKKYEPSIMKELTFKRYDLAFKTDEEGNPIQLFMGRKDTDGKIKGDRFTRVLKFDREGKILKDHWDHKGKAT